MFIDEMINASMLNCILISPFLEDCCTLHFYNEKKAFAYLRHHEYAKCGSLVGNDAAIRIVMTRARDYDIGLFIVL